MIQTECSTDVENGREVIVYIIFTPFTFRVTRIRANLPACHKEWRSKAALLQIMCSLMSWDRERYDLISSWKLTLLFAWFGCTDDSKDTTRHANKTTCTCWSTSGVVSGLLGCIKTLSCVRVREHMDDYELLYLEVALHASLEVMNETKYSNRLSGLSDIRDPWFPSEYPTTSTPLLCGSVASFRRTSRLENTTSAPS